jgi:hypothetical protein
MGMLITVTEFETNRALTGMAHERYVAGETVEGTRPPDLAARALFAHGGAQSVHVHGNQINVELAPGASTDGMAEAIADLFIHYKPGVTPSL